jgi:hypothetical protein
MIKKYLFFILILLSLMSLIPYSTVEIPELKIKVIDMNGVILPNVEVIQTWTTNKYLDEMSEIKASDLEGNVVFSERKLFVPIILRILIRSEETFSYLIMPHGSEHGARAKIWSKRGSSYDWLYYYPNGKMSEVLVIKE